MAEKHMVAVMERTYAQRQEKFIRLFLHVSPHLAELREHKDLTKRVEDVCAQVVHELMPGQVTNDSYQSYAETSDEEMQLGKERVQVSSIHKAHRLIQERLIQDDFVRSYINSHSEHPDSLDVHTSGIAYIVSEAHRYFLQRQIMPKSAWQRNTSQ